MDTDRFTEPVSTSPSRVDSGKFKQTKVSSNIVKPTTKELDNFVDHDGLLKGANRHKTSPDGYFYVDEDVLFNPAVHLALDEPEKVVSLHHLGYTAADTKDLPSSFGCTTPFRLLSDKGLEQVRLALARLRQYEQSCTRIPAVLRGACFRSRFLRDLTECELVRKHISTLVGCPLVLHPMWIQQAHTNFAPKEASRNIDLWHTDGTAFVVVLFVTDEEEYDGGKFEYFSGTGAEGRAILKSGAPLPEERVRHLPHQRAGCCALMQGSALFHRVSPLTRGCERTTVVISYHSLDCNTWEPVTTVSETYNEIDPLHVILPDWTAYRAWRGSRRLTDALKQVNETELDLDSMDTVKAARKACTRLTTVADRVAWTDDREVLSQLIMDAVCPLWPHEFGGCEDDCPSLKALRRAIERTVMEAERAVTDVTSLHTSQMEFY